MKRALSFAAILLLTAAIGYAQTDEQLEDEFIQTKADNGESHASGMRAELGPVTLGNPTDSVAVLRVGIYRSVGTSEFSSLHHPSVDISHTAGDVHIIDESTGKQIIDIVPGQITHVTYSSAAANYDVTVDGIELGQFTGPIFFRPTDATNQFRVESIFRTFNGSKVPLYRGAIEIARGTATLADRVNVVNVIEVEDYVPGVVANESIASFHIEALKAQAVAARGYAIANVGRYEKLGYPFDIVDSSSSQVYRGVISEHPNAVRAASETYGLVGSYDGKIIDALYSSSFGGHSESSEWIFNTILPSTNVVPYLRGIYDGDGVAPDFSTDAGIASFWKNPQPAGFDDCTRPGNSVNRFARWNLTLTAAQIKARLTASRIKVISGNTTGSITDIAVTTRMTASARIAVATITLTSGVVEVRGWDNLRAVLGTTAVSTPATCGSTIAASFALNNPSIIEVTKSNGLVTTLKAWGGGWGHNLGMSQYGANGRGKAGQSFLQILNAYYTGVDIGTHPIDIGRNPGSGPPTLRQQFYAATAQGKLVVRAQPGLKKLMVHVNDTYDIAIDDSATVDISPYLVPGLNTIQYNPVGRDGSANVVVVID